MRTFLWLSLAAAAATSAPAADLVIQNAKILTVTKGRLDGSIHIRDGKIVEVAPKILVPAGAEVLDAAGMYVMPGIVDCHSHIAAESINEGSVSVSSMVGIEDVIDPDDVGIYRALAGGVTTANILHGSANAIGGKCQVLKMRWGKDAAGLKFAGAKPGIKFALGENPKRRGQQAAFGATTLRYPATRMGVEDVIREAFLEAKQYQAEWKSYRNTPAAGGRVAPRRDLKLEALVEVLEGQRLVHAHCYRADEILMLIRLADEQGFKIKTFQHVLEGYKVAKEIAAHGGGASTFSDWWAYKVEAFDATPYNAAIMHKKGVLVSLNSDSGELMRHLNNEAAKAVKYGGVSEDEALAMVTINPARQMEIDARIGSIEPGKDADLAMFDGYPLSNYAKVQKVFIDGQLYFDRQKDLARRAEQTARRKVLLEKQAKPQDEPGRRGPGRRTE
ncbi:MAG: amidohydrolase [Bryobacterales bacterium]|nr:amidohydrolase [Bryobacterales bacterium]